MSQYFDDLAPETKANPQNLPSLLPQTSPILQRAQTSLRLVHDVVQESSAEYWYTLGEEASTTGNWAAASYAYQKCITLDNHDWDGALQLSAALIMQQKIHDAAKYLLLAYNIHELTTWFSWQLSTKQKLYLKSEFEKRVYSNQICFEIHLALAVLYTMENEHDKAKSILKNISENFINEIKFSSLYYRLIGNLTEGEGPEFLPYARISLEFYDLAIEIEENSSFLYFERGEVKLYFEDYTGALNDFNSAINLLPNIYYFYQCRAEAFEGLGETEKSALNSKISKRVLEEVRAVARVKNRKKKAWIKSD